LKNSKANFRFFFSLRYIDDKGDYVTAEGVSPSLSAYWECDPSKKDDRNGVAKYIRDGISPRFGPLPAWDEVVLVVKSNSLLQLRVAVFDVNRKDWTDTLRELGGGLVSSLFDTASTVTNLPVVGSLAGTLLEHVKKSVLDSFAKEDDLLFTSDYNFPSTSNGGFELKDGGYIVSLHCGALPTTNQSADPVDKHSVFSRVLTWSASLLAKRRLTELMARSAPADPA
jgi:hypothetical protein